MAREKRFGERKSEFEQKVVEVSRVTRVVAGGKRMRFRALVVIGDKKGRVGAAIRKGSDVSEAVRKAATAARKTLIVVPMVSGTIPHQVLSKYKASKVMLKPAPAGTGVIAGGPVRSVVESAGISDIVSKMLGSPSKINNVRAALQALSELKQPRNRTGANGEAKKSQAPKPQTKPE